MENLIYIKTYKGNDSMAYRKECDLLRASRSALFVRNNKTSRDGLSKRLQGMNIQMLLLQAIKWRLILFNHLSSQMPFLSYSANNLDWHI